MTEQHLKEPAPSTTAPAGESPRSITLQIPKPNWQLTALLLVALIAGFQTFQLLRLKGSVSAKTAAATPAATSAAASSSSSTDSSGLQSQVGGC